MTSDKNTIIIEHAGENDNIIARRGRFSFLVTTAGLTQLVYNIVYCSAKYVRAC